MTLLSLFTPTLYLCGVYTNVNHSSCLTDFLSNRMQSVGRYKYEFIFNFRILCYIFLANYSGNFCLATHREGGEGGSFCTGEHSDYVDCHS